MSCMRNRNHLPRDMGEYAPDLGFVGMIQQFGGGRPDVIPLTVGQLG